MSKIDMDNLTHMTALLDVGKIAKDLETIGAIMVTIGLHVPDEDIGQEWMVFFGRAIEEISVNLDAVDGVLNP